MCTVKDNAGVVQRLHIRLWWQAATWTGFKCRDRAAQHHFTGRMLSSLHLSSWSNKHIQQDSDMGKLCGFYVLCCACVTWHMLQDKRKMYNRWIYCEDCPYRCGSMVPVTCVIGFLENNAGLLQRSKSTSAAFVPFIRAVSSKSMAWWWKQKAAFNSTFVSKYVNETEQKKTTFACMSGTRAITEIWNAMYIFVLQSMKGIYTWTCLLRYIPQGKDEWYFDKGENQSSSQSSSSHEAY